jgi:hypothetical protein
LKTYNSTNFFKHTFCEFQQVENFSFPENTNYKSKSESTYYYSDDGVYRKSNHWGRVANCRWTLKSTSTYKSQHIVIGFAKWTDFHPINSSEKSFSISVNFDEEKAEIQSINKDIDNFLFNYKDAKDRVQKINHLFKNDKWLNYIEGNKESIKKRIISEIISSDKTFTEIKAAIH